MSKRLAPLCLALVIWSLPAASTAQTSDGLGTRAQGMGGAFVGVADDASAVYWNPAGLAGGSYFSLVLDGGTQRTVPGGGDLAAARSAWLLAASMPALGLSYYRLQFSSVKPSTSAGASTVESLVTQNVGATLVQTISGGLSAGVTLKMVRGVAAEADFTGATPKQLLDDADLLGHGGTRVDLDAGLMVTGSMGRAGLVVRNVSEPEFRTASGRELRVDRQVRGGLSILLLQGWKLAADVDLTRHRGAFGDVRELAIGSEGQITKRLAGRAGLRFNTLEDASPAGSVGASYAVYGAVLVDAQVTGGSDNAFRGWGIAARFIF